MQYSILKPFYPFFVCSHSSYFFSSFFFQPSSFLYLFILPPLRSQIFRFLLMRFNFSSLIFLSVSFNQLHSFSCIFFILFLPLLYSFSFLFFFIPFLFYFFHSLFLFFFFLFFLFIFYHFSFLLSFFFLYAFRPKNFLKISPSLSNLYTLITFPSFRPPFYIALFFFLYASKSHLSFLLSSHFSLSLSLSLSFTLSLSLSLSLSFFDPFFFFLFSQSNNKSTLLLQKAFHKHLLSILRGVLLNFPLAEYSRRLCCETSWNWFLETIQRITLLSKILHRFTKI